MSARVYPQALDYAAGVLAKAIGVQKVAREPIDALEGDEDAHKGVRVVCALSDGIGIETGYCMGASKPYEFERAAALELVVIGGSEEERSTKAEEVITAAAAAIEADRTLGGLVDDAVVEEADPEMEERYAGLAASLRLTYTAQTALG
jgi:hypothetical protein